MNRQELIDAIVELTREPDSSVLAFTMMLSMLPIDQLGRLFDALADYDDVRREAAKRRAAAEDTVQ